MSGFLCILIICIGVAALAGYNMIKLREIISFLRGTHTEMILSSQELIANVHQVTFALGDIVKSQPKEDLLISYETSKESANSKLSSMESYMNDPFLKKATSVKAFLVTTRSMYHEISMKVQLTY
jgi:hypothetical protein